MHLPTTELGYTFGSAVYKSYAEFVNFAQEALYKMHFPEKEPPFLSNANSTQVFVDSSVHLWLHDLFVCPASSAPI